MLVNNIVSPQGCVVSPLLSILYTDDCRSTHPDSHLVKYEDDTVLLSLLSGSPHPHSSVHHEFVEWCDNSSLELNVEKTKEMVVTFSSKHFRQHLKISLQHREHPQAMPAAAVAPKEA